jgi:hypothetical protein
MPVALVVAAIRRTVAVNIVIRIAHYKLDQEKDFIFVFKCKGVPVE